MTEETKVNALNWFEIPATDFDRAVDFYNNILQSELYKQSMGNINMGMFPHNGLGGAIVAGEGYEPGMNGPVVYLNCGEDLAPTLGRIEAAGGQVLVPKTQITPEYGYFALFIDSEGNKIGLHSMN